MFNLGDESAQEVPHRWKPGSGYATPSFALFGIGDIVFDPTSYASLVSQATTALNQSRRIQNNVEHFSVKQQWQTTLTSSKNANVANMFGETAESTLRSIPTRRRHR